MHGADTSDKKMKICTTQENNSNAIFPFHMNREPMAGFSNPLLTDLISLKCLTNN